MKTNNAEHTATPTITLDTSNNKRIEADITPPLNWAVTIPTTVNKTQLVIYIGNSAFDTQSSVDVKDAIGQLTHFITRACNAHDELVEALKRMKRMWEMMMEKVDHGASFYDADTIREMNEAPLDANKALAKAEAKPT